MLILFLNTSPQGTVVPPPPPPVDYTALATTIMAQIYAAVKKTAPSAAKNQVWNTVGIPILAAALKARS